MACLLTIYYFYNLKFIFTSIAIIVFLYQVDLFEMTLKLPNSINIFSIKKVKNQIRIGMSENNSLKTKFVIIKFKMLRKLDLYNS